MLSLIFLEFKKLLGYRSVRLAVLVLLILPWIWAFAPQTGMSRSYQFAFVSAWQMPAFSLLTSTQFILPLLIGLTAAELLGAEIVAGTLSPFLLRPLERYKALLAKYFVALLYPLLLLAVLLLASLLAGARFGVGDFVGGSGLTAGGFAGSGVLTPSEALPQILRAYFLAAITLAPISALALMYCVIFLNTTAATLATIATVNVLRLLTVYPALDGWKFTDYLEAYVAGPDTVLKAVVILLLYTVAIMAIGLYLFEKKDL